MNTVIPATPSEFETFLLQMSQQSHGKVPATLEQYFARSVKGWSVGKSGKVCSIMLGNYKTYSLKKAIALTEKEFSEFSVNQA